MPVQEFKRTVLKGCSVGACLGGLISAVVLIACTQIGPGERSGGLILTIPWLMTILPARLLYALFRWSWTVDSVKAVSAAIFWSVLLINSLLGALLGGGIGLVQAVLKRWRSAKPVDEVE